MEHWLEVIVLLILLSAVVDWLLCGLIWFILITVLVDVRPLGHLSQDTGMGHNDRRIGAAEEQIGITSIARCSPSLIVEIGLVLDVLVQNSRTAVLAGRSLSSLGTSTVAEIHTFIVTIGRFVLIQFFLIVFSIVFRMKAFNVILLNLNRLDLPFRILQLLFSRLLFRRNWFFRLFLHSLDLI